MSTIISAIALLSATEAQATQFDQDHLIRNLVQLSTALERALPPVEISRLRAAIAQGNATKADALLTQHSALEVRINPETRVSVEALALPLGACPDRPWIVRIVNDGSATSTLTMVTAPAQLANLQLEGANARLSGARVEYRLLNIAVSERGPVEVVIGFSVGRSSADLGGRAILPLLLFCPAD